MTRSLLASAALVLGLASCGDSGASPLGPTELVSDSLRVAVRAVPSQVARGDAFDVTTVFENRLDREMELTFGAGCRFFLDVRHQASGRHVPFEGSEYACTLVGSSWTIPAHDSVTTINPLGAHVGGTPVDPGLYAVRLHFTAVLFDDLDAAVLVR